MFADRYIRRAERRGCGWRLRRTDEVWPTSAAGDAAQPAARQLRQHRRRHDRRLHPDILQRQIDARRPRPRHQRDSGDGGWRGARYSQVEDGSRETASEARYIFTVEKAFCWRRSPWRRLRESSNILSRSTAQSLEWAVRPDSDSKCLMMIFHKQVTGELTNLTTTI